MCNVHQMYLEKYNIGPTVSYFVLLHSKSVLVASGITRPIVRIFVNVADT
jgi:hypothetical protein